MLTEYEAWKLQSQMRKELNATTGFVPVCALALFSLVGLPWIGAVHDMPAAREPWHPANQAVSRGTPSSKDVFDERRRRFIETYPDSHVACEGGLQQSADAN